MLGYCKVCDLADFEDGGLRKLIGEIFSSDREHFGERHFPRGREYRKYWEVAMSVRALGDHGALHEDSQLLGVGAGHEATVYWLTRHARRVIATDLYLDQDDWSGSDSGAEMLVDPGKYWDGPWNPSRLVVQHMNALELEYEDESFDGVFSSSSIEHFGDFADVRRAVEEIYRVLRPGGVAAISTEFRLAGPGPGWPGVIMFDEAELRSVILDGLWWDPASPFDARISDETLGAPVEFQEALADQAGGIRGWSQYPHIVLREGPFLWTSVHLTLIKSAAPAREWRAGALKLPMPPMPPKPRKPWRERFGARIASALPSWVPRPRR